MLAAQSSPVSTIAFAAVVLVTSTAIVAALAWAARRLLGSPVGALRALIAGLLGFLAAYFLGRALQAAQPGHQVAFITVALGVPLVVAMIFLVVAEALVPSGMVPQPLEVIRGTRQAVARSRRYGQISRSRCGMAWARTCAGGAAPRGRGWRSGGARAVAAACTGGGRGDLYQAGPAAVHPPRSAPGGIHFRTRPAPGPGRAGALGTGRKGDSRVAGGAGWAGFRRAAARAGRRRIDRPGAQGPAA